MPSELVHRFALRARIVHVERLGSSARLIRLAAPELEGLAWTPGQHVRVLVTGPLNALTDLLHMTLRSYSIWSHRGPELELCVYEHEDEGPGALWAQSVQPGDEISFRRPEGRLVLDPDAPYHLFVGEETASVPFAAMLRALPSGTNAFGVIEVDTPDDRIALPDSITWTYRAGGTAASSEGLVTALRELKLPGKPGIAYVAGEARTIQMVRKHLVKDRDWPRRNVVTKPFWTPGRRGMD